MHSDVGHPLEQYPPTLFVLGTSRDSGKTVTCVGLIAKLIADYRLSSCDIGYMKPVGQQTVSVQAADGGWREVDKDAVLVTGLMAIDCPDYERVSPVVWLKGFTEECLDACCTTGPLTMRQRLLERICASYERVARGKAVVLVEGTGQLGVGSVAGVCNADVIRALRGMGAPVHVLISARNHTGDVIDTLFPYLVALRHLGVHAVGLIVTRMAPGELARIRTELADYYERVFPHMYAMSRVSHTASRPRAFAIADDPPRLLGCVPEIPELAMPSVRLIAEYFQGKRKSGLSLVAPADFAARAATLVERVRVVSLQEGYQPLIRPGDAVIVGGNANERIAALLDYQEGQWRRGQAGLSCLFLSCGHIGGLRPDLHERLVRSQLPVLRLDYDSAEIARQVRSLRVKVQTYDTIKRELIARAYCDHVAPLPGLGPPPDVP